MRAQGSSKEKLEALKTEMLERSKIYKRLFSGPDGKAILEDLRKRCFIDRTTFPGNDSALRMAFNEGRRSIFVHINNQVEKDAEALFSDLTKGKEG